MNLWPTVIDCIRAGDVRGVQNLSYVRDFKVNEAGEAGMTPLHLAALFGRAEIASILLARGADINKRDDQGRSPLLLAAEYGQVAVAKVLLARGASPAVRAKSSETALHLAVRCPGPPHEPDAGPGDPQGMTELLATHKYLLDYRLADGRTALMITAADANVGMMRALLHAGADQCLTDNRGFTAADWARETGARYAVQVLDEELTDKAADEARNGLAKRVRVSHALKLKIPKIR